MDTLRVSEDLTLEVHTDDETPLLRLRDASLEQDGECTTGILIWPNEVKALIDCLAVAAGLCAQEAATAPPGTSGAWAFGCTLGLAQGTCGAYLADANSRGAAARLGGCPSCAHREPDNAKTRTVETAAGLVLPRRAYQVGAADEVSAG